MAKYLSDPEGSADNYDETTTLPDMDTRCSSGDDDCAALPDKLPPLSEARRAPRPRIVFPLLWVKSHQPGGRTYHYFRRAGFPTVRPPARRTGVAEIPCYLRRDQPWR
jgi:hypothetical protein